MEIVAATRQRGMRHDGVDDGALRIPHPLATKYPYITAPSLSQIQIGDVLLYIYLAS